MKLYSSFLIRCWAPQDSAHAEKFVFEVEHIQRGERMRFGDLNEARQWMMRILQTRQPEQPEPEDDAPETDTNS